MTELDAMFAQLDSIRALRKAFARLPMPKVKPEASVLPVGTTRLGKVKVSTSRGDRWKAGRRGMVRSNEPALKDGQWGYPESGREASKSELCASDDEVTAR